jgi:hypothetical protein
LFVRLSLSSRENKRHWHDSQKENNYSFHVKKQFNAALAALKIVQYCSK